MIGQYLGGYRILRPIGSGCMGHVYEAINGPLGRRAAIKVLRPEWAASWEVARRFLNEARAVNAVKHPGLVDIYQAGRRADGILYLVMEYLDGESLFSRLQRRGRLDLDGILIARQIAEAMAAAHRRGIIHRDLKPGNVMLVSDPALGGQDRVKVLDFGVAKLSPALQAGSSDGMRTQPGVIMGTPTYMAPEQWLGAATINDRADVYSLGTMLYQMIAGTPPYVGAQDELCRMHLEHTPRPLRERDPGVELELADLVHRMLARSPAARPSMSEIVVALDHHYGRPTERMTLAALTRLDEPPEDLPSLVVVIEPEAPAAPSVPARGRRAPRAATALLAMGLCGTGDPWPVVTTRPAVSAPVAPQPAPPAADGPRRFHPIAPGAAVAAPPVPQPPVQVRRVKAPPKTHVFAPGNLDALVRQGDDAFEREHWAEAVQSLRQANRLAPEDGIIEEKLAAALFRRGRLGEVVAFCRQALRRDPHHGRIQEILRRAEADVPPLRPDDNALPFAVPW